MMENKEIIELAYENDAIYVACGEGDYGSTEHDDIIKFAYAFLAKIDEERAAIRPPVAAGSVDIEEILRGIDQDEVESDDGLWETSFGADFGRKKKAEIIAWGAQQRIEGKREGADTVAMAEQMKLFRSSHDEACIELKERAEKAEANEIRLQQLVIEAQDRAEKAEARVKDLEREKSAPTCDCHACQPITMENNRMILCATCGNKRCPHANDHRNACTGSNELGQAGSAYA